MDCIVEMDLARNLAEQDRRAARLDAIEQLAGELLEDPQFIWDWLGDIDQGDGLRGQAVAGIVRAVRAEMTRNPALAHRYRRLASERSTEPTEGGGEMFKGFLIYGLICWASIKGVSEFGGQLIGYLG